MPLLKKFALLMKSKYNCGQRRSRSNLLGTSSEIEQPNPTFAKIPILDTGKFEQWKFKIQQYLQNEHYALREVIEFGGSYEAPQDVADISSASEGSAKKKGRTVAVTTEDMQKRRNDTFGGNEATKKTKKNQLKQQYGNFKAEGKKTLEQTFNILQAIVSHLEFMDVEIEQDDLNQKFLTSLAPEWLMYTIVWRNRSDLDTMTKTSSRKEEVNTASFSTASTYVSPASADVATASFSYDTVCTYIASQSNGSQVKYEDINQIDKDDIKEIDIKECRAPRSQDRGRRENFKQGSKTEEQTPKALMAIDGVGWDWSYMAIEEENHALVANKEALTEFALMAKSSFENEVFDNSLCSKACKKNKDSLNTKITELSEKLSDTKTTLYHYKLGLSQVYEKIRGPEFIVESKDNRIERLTKELEELKKEKEGLDSKLTVMFPPPAQVYSPPKKDMSWTGLPDFVDDTITDYSRPSPSIESNFSDLHNSDSSVSEKGDSSESIMSKPMIKFVKATYSPTEVKISKVKTVRKPSVKYAEMYRNTTKSPKVMGNQRDWNNLKTQQLGKDFVMKNKACFKCGQFDHLAYDYAVWEKQGKTWPKNNNTHKSMSPRNVFHKTSRQPMRTNRPNMNDAQPKRISFTKPAHSYVRRPFQRTSAVRTQFRVPRVSTANIKFPTVNKNFPLNSTNKGPNSNSVLVIFKKYQYIDTQGRLNGFSRHMTGNISYLSDYEPYDGGYVSFGQGGGKITGKGIIKTAKDDTNVLLRTPRQHNMYSIDFNNIVPHKDLTCLVVKASTDESVLWHRRLGHLNFKIMNKLVRHNLVRGLPSKCFENDHTCVACLKGKQHKASCKTKLVHSVTKPLHTLHMDLFGPTSVSSLNHKWYCLVVTDDFSRFTWTFFLKTKDETSGILRNFITEIENLKELKVKIIKCDNRGEFRNKEMNDFCSRKWIKREFSNARTPQHNGVAEKRNRTLIEAARTMLADAKLPVTFWAEAVNTACYVQNRVLVNKSQNKTPYELFNGRTPAIGFLKPFRCHVMILNTLDNLGKFDAKGDEGYFIGYSMSSKEFRVFNKRTKRVEENLHVNFLENKLIEKGAGPNWLFDIDTLTNSMNYVPVVDAGTTSTNFLAHLDSSTSNAQDACNVDTPESSGNSNPTATSTNPSADRMETLTVETLIPTVSSPVLTACLNDSPEPSSDTRLISKRVTSQDDTPSLDNILTLSNMFEDILRVTTNTGDSHRVEADLGNIENNISASPTPTFRIHKDYPKSQIIGHVDTPVQTKTKSKEMEEQRVRPIGTKWVLKNKKDERGIVIRNKARLVAQGHTQEEGIDYKEVFAPVARIKAIRLFLAYASFMGFTVYQMDVKSAFLYGTIDEEVYMMQPPRFQDPEFPARVYKVEKVMYGLHHAPRAWYGTLSKYLLTNGFQRGTIDHTLFIRKHRGDFILVQVYVDDIIFGSLNLQLCREFEALTHEKFQMSAMGELNFFLGLQVLQKKDGIFLSQDKYVGDILKRFRYSDVRSANTPMDKENPWGKDRTGKDVDLHLYRSMIRTLMYLTASRPDIMFVVCACARHQVTPKECHLHAVKRIFRYLKVHPKLGIWYPKDSPFNLVAYSDSDYGGAT
uniref:Integrase catalytic domain-containing protein n=1 Tax=Tanacetum cinerariifolium TaxID=118510 RepID=A0A699HQA4_TANCI|nr:hypothetical protein [Tanacetum cinerariifolium]